MSALHGHLYLGDGEVPAHLLDRDGSVWVERADGFICLDDPSDLDDPDLLGKPLDWVIATWGLEALPESMSAPAYDLSTTEGRVAALRAAHAMLAEARRLTAEGDALLTEAIRATEAAYRERLRDNPGS